MTQIHPTALVSPEAKLGKNVQVGPYSIIDENVTIGDETVIHSHAIIRPYTTLGKKCRIFSGAVVGEVPQDISFDSDKKTFCQVGEGTTIREYVTIHRGTEENSKTVIGKNCFFMVNSHVAHNCQIADNVSLANAVLLGGHVEIGEHCFLGGGGVYQQFARIGKYSICSGNIAINVDIPPFMMAIGYRPWIRGLNLIGLKRAGFSREAINNLKACQRILYRSGLSFLKALEQVEDEIDSEEVRYLIDFCRTSSRYPTCSRGKMDAHLM